jgi:hypothetical protein
MKTKNMEISPQLAKKLEVLQALPPRSMDAAARGREQFLMEARILTAAVSETEKQRPKDVSLFNRIKEVFHIRKERFAMSVLSAILLIVTLLVGGAGGTVYAAQGSLPDQTLYPVKIVSEDVRLQLAGDPQSRLSLLEEFSTRRVEELVALITAGETPSEEVVSRLQDQLQKSLELAAELTDDQLNPALLQLREQLQTQEEEMEQLQVEQGSKTMVVMNKAQTIIRVQLRTVEDGMVNMEVFRLHIRNKGDNQELEVKNSVDDSAAETLESEEDSLNNPEVKETVGPDDNENPKMNKTPEPGDDDQDQGQENGQKPNDDKKDSDPQLTKTPSGQGPDNSGKGNPSNSGQDDDQGNGNSDKSN